MHACMHSCCIRCAARLVQEGEESECTAREGTYVRVHGHLRSFNNRRSVVAGAVRPVQDLNELTNHLLELVLVRAHHRNALRSAEQTTAVSRVANSC